MPNQDWENLPPEQQAINPELPIDRLHVLAHLYPKEVLENPILPLLFLEDPTRAEEIVKDAQSNYVSQVLSALLERSTEEQRRRWLCVCLEKLLPFYESQSPSERRPQEAIDTALAFLRGEASLSALHAASAASAIIPHESAPIRRGATTSWSGTKFLCDKIAYLAGKVAARHISFNDALDLVQDLTIAFVELAKQNSPLVFASEHVEKDIGWREQVKALNDIADELALILKE